MKALIGSACAVAAVLLAASWTHTPAVGQNKAVAAGPLWEYKVLTKLVIETNTWLSEAELNKLGAEGWELTTTSPVAISLNRPTVTLIFKRHKR